MSNYFRKSRFSKAVTGFTGFLVAFMMIGGVGVAPAQAQLEESQIQSILNLLSSFGADQATIDNVDSALRGEPTSGTGGGSGSGSGGSCSYTFTQNLTTGSTGTEVMNLQKFLNMDPDTQLASSGPGSPGNETSYFGSITASGVTKFQNKYSAEVLAPVGLSTGTGYWGPSSRAHANVVCANMDGGDGDGGTGDGGGTGTGGVNVSSASQPSNGLFVQNAARVAFTKFTVTNNSSSNATINSVTVEKSGAISRNAFDSVVLLDGNMNQLGDGRSLNSNNQATVGKSTTIPAGGSVTFTVAANAPSSLSSQAGQVGGLNVVAINTGSSVSGSLPISGANHTVNSSLSIGSVTIDEGTNDPDVDRDKEIGTTDYRFSSIKIDAGSEEDIRLHSVRWTNNGTVDLSDLSNLEVEVDGTTYPVTMDGDTVTASFGNGIVIQEGNNVDVSISGDITGSGANSDTVQFDIEETYDIYVTGETFGYGILPSASTSGSAGDSGSQFPTSGNPFFDGSKVTITGGSVSSISKSNSVPSQNVAINVTNQPLGAFTTNLLGEALEVDGITFGIDTNGTAATNITNVTLVNENGSVVAGPVDGATGGGNDGKVAFTDLIEFPTGSHTYTLRGKVGTSFSDGDTIKATTTVNSTYWTDPEGAETGDAYTLPGNTITMNTMTVKAGSLNISVGSTPAAQTIVAGAQDFTFANYIFDATGSGEDVRFSSIALRQTTGDATEISGCQLWDGSTALNRGGNVVNSPNIGSDTTFTFSDTFTVPKGTTKTVALKCDLASGASTNVQWGIDSGANPSVTGVQSGTSISESISASNGPLMTVSAAGTVTVSVDSSDPSERWYVAGTEATTGVFELSGTNESFELTDLELQLDNASSSASDIAEIALFDGTTELVRIPSPAFTNNNETFNIDGFTVPKDDDANLTVKVKFGEVGVGKAGASGSLVRFATSTNAANNEARGTESGSTVTLQGNVGTTTGARYFRSLPTLANVSSANISSTLSNGTKELYRFTVSADSARDVGVKQFTFNVATTGATATSFKLTEVNTGKVVQSGVASDGNDNVTINVANGTYGSQFITVSAGSSRTYKLEATVAGAATSGDTITTKLLQDSAYPSLASGELMGQAGNLTGSNNFVWSPFSTTSALGTNDWTNGFRVPGIEFDDLSDFSRSVN